MRKRRGDAKRKADLMAKFDDAIKTITDDKNPPTLRSAKDMIQAAEGNGK
ncbi:hypothetical protein HQ560_15880 [bacterium]|nr:hypothetical protein [bacterium]